MNNLLFHIIKFKLRLFSKLLTKKNDEGKVVILSFKFIGDTVFTIPSIKIIKQKSSGKKVVIFCFEDSVPVYQLAFNNLEYVTFKKDELNFESRFPNKNLINKLRRQNPAVLFDLTCEYQTAVAVFFSGSKNTIGFNTKYYEGIYKVFTEKRTQPDLINMHLDPVKKFFNLKENDFEKEFVNNYKRDDKIIIHPFAGWKAKEWGFDNFIKLANELSEFYEIEIIVKEKSLQDEEQNELIKSGIKIVGTKTVDELISEIKNCSVVISNDSGPLYIAAFLGKATFTIYGPTNPKYSLPSGNHHAFIREVIECSPEPGKQYCYTYGGRYCKTFDCMKNLSFLKVKNEVIEFLETSGIEKTKVHSLNHQN